jgi:Tfp pilus assembly protein FimT
MFGIGLIELLLILGALVAVMVVLAIVVVQTTRRK